MHRLPRTCFKLANYQDPDALALKRYLHQSAKVSSIIQLRRQYFLEEGISAAFVHSHKKRRLRPQLAADPTVRKIVQVA